MPPSTVHRLLATLAQEGVLRQREGNGQYELALDFYRLAHLVAGRTPLRDIARRHARNLVAARNEAVLFNLYDPGRQMMMTIAHLESMHTLRYVIDTEQWKPIHVGATGHAIMAFLTATERREIIERTGLQAMTDRSITDSDQLELELAVVRQRGYACTRGQRTVGAVGIAAPVFAPNGAVLGDICFTIPESRFEPAAEPKLASLLLTCADAIMEEIGGKRPSEHLRGVTA
jgi:DNA-binding IclR family transcriptional regulator